MLHLYMMLVDVWLDIPGRRYGSWLSRYPVEADRLTDERLRVHVAEEYRRGNTEALSH